VILSRPGTGGSSGNQWRDGKTVRETAILDAALDALASRYGVARWAVAGQSGGAAAAANLLARRRNIACAALGSGPLALRAQLARQGARGDVVAGLDDPIDHVGAIRADPARRVFVLSDALDSLVPTAVQDPWVQAATGHGHAVRHLVRSGWGAGPQHHDLTPQAVLAASLCARGTATGGIVDAVLAGGPLGQPEPPPPPPPLLLLLQARTDSPR
jgi:pimeloyl-ACP methyl ester carboxylesterase